MAFVKVVVVVGNIGNVGNVGISKIVKQRKPGLSTTADLPPAAKSTSRHHSNRRILLTGRGSGLGLSRIA